MPSTKGVKPTGNPIGVAASPPEGNNLNNGCPGYKSAVQSAVPRPTIESATTTLDRKM